MKQSIVNQSTLNEGILNKSQADLLLEAEILDFINSKKTLQLATVDVKAKPNASYAPFVYFEQGFYVLISELARHTQNILNNPSASLMLIEEESEAKNLYARVRLTFDAEAVIVSRETQQWQDVIELMINRLGNTEQGLSQFTDFHLVKLKVKQGLYVKGFGQAYQVLANDLAHQIHINKGHSNA
ncbi:pyridoxamine 5'-phosphate oxidase family protein [Vibrio sp. 1-Bac 57]